MRLSYTILVFLLTSLSVFSQGVDIRIEKDDGDGVADDLTVIAGQDQITYTVTVTNDGPSDATGIVVNDPLTLPTGVSLNNASESQGTYIPGTGIWTVGNLTNGANATLTIVLDVGPNTADGQVISNTASLDSVDETDINPNNDSDTETTDVAREIDLRVFLIEVPNDIALIAGQDQVVYNLQIRNNGPSNASGIIASFPLSLPTGVTLLSFPSSPAE